MELSRTCAVGLAIAVIGGVVAQPAAALITFEGSIAFVDSATLDVSIVAFGSGGDEDRFGGSQQDLLFDSRVLSLPNAAACRINPEIGTTAAGCEQDPVVGPCKTLSRNLASCGSSPTPPGCDGQPANISRFRGIVASTAVPNRNPIPDGSVLFTCRFNWTGAPTAIRIGNVVASAPTGTRLDTDVASSPLVVGTPGPSPTRTGTRTPTPSPTPTNSATPTNTPTVTRTPTTKPSCIGDCGGDGQVTVEELVEGIAIALGLRNVGSCPLFDANGDARVTVEELVSAIAAALNGC